MFDHVEIANYRCFRSVSVDLKPLTVLIGQNNTGKSSFLAALGMLGGIERFIEPTDRFRKAYAPGHVSAETSWESSKARLGLVIEERSVPPFKGDTDFVRPMVRFQLPVSGPSLTCVGVTDNPMPPAIESNGGNVAALVDYLLRRDRKRFDDLVRFLREHVPGLADLKVITPDPSRRRIDVEAENGLVVSEERMSAGVRMMLFFAAVAFHPKPPRVILIEEPETGLHPKRLGQVLAVLRGIAERKKPHKPNRLADDAAQVILTTHSPDLLDYIDLSKDQVLVFQRQTDGTCAATPANRELLDPFLKDFMLGEVWYSRDDEGLLSAGQADAVPLTDPSHVLG